MDSLLEELAKLEKKGNLTKSVDNVQKTIDILVRARDSIAESMCDVSASCSRRYPICKTVAD